MYCLCCIFAHIAIKDKAKTMESQVKSEKSTLSDQFHKAYYELPVGLYSEVKREIMEETGWKTSSFYNKLRGSRPFKKLEIKAVADVFRKHGVDVFNLTN